MYYRNRQSGAAVSYIIIGIVLVALALGALYGARQYMASQRTAPISVEDMQTASNESDDKSSEKSKLDDEKDQKTADQEKDKEKESNDSKDENSTKEESTQPESTPQADQSTEAPLPQTGPTSDILTALVLGVTAAASLAYFRSQRII